jgi:hypothetical protein
VRCSVRAANSMGDSEGGGAHTHARTHAPFDFYLPSELPDVNTGFGFVTRRTSVMGAHNRLHRLWLRCTSMPAFVFEPLAHGGPEPRGARSEERGGRRGRRGAGRVSISTATALAPPRFYGPPAHTARAQHTVHCSRTQLDSRFGADGRDSRL